MGGEDIKKEIVSWRREKKIATRVGVDKEKHDLVDRKRDREVVMLGGKRVEEEWYEWKIDAKLRCGGDRLFCEGLNIDRKVIMPGELGGNNEVVEGDVLWIIGMDWLEGWGMVMDMRKEELKIRKMEIRLNTERILKEHIRVEL